MILCNISHRSAITGMYLYRALKFTKLWLDTLPFVVVKHYIIVIRNFGSGTKKFLTFKGIPDVVVCHSHMGFGLRHTNECCKGDKAIISISTCRRQHMRDGIQFKILRPFTFLQFCIHCFHYRSRFYYHIYNLIKVKVCCKMKISKSLHIHIHRIYIFGLLVI